MDDDVTELDELDAQKVSGVGSPANGTPWLLLKSEDVQATAERETLSQEADEQEDRMTKAEADEIENLLTKSGLWSSYCGIEECEVCKGLWDLLPPNLLEKAKLKAKQRNALPDSAFALPGRRYPIHDANHARNALSRGAQHATPEELATIKRKVKRRYPEIEVGGGKAEKSPGVPAESVATPKEKGHLATGQSGLAGPMTRGIRPDHSNPSFTYGGETSFTIPEEERIGRRNVAGLPPMDRPGEGGVVVQKEEDGWTIEVVEKQNWVTLDDTTVQGDASTPGSPEWEDFDASTLDSVARGLAEAKRCVVEIQRREVAEAVAGDPHDWFDAMQLECAAEDICSALGLVAALAYREAAEGTGAEKEATAAAIQKASTILTGLLGEPQRTSEEDEMATITKEELNAQIEQTATSAAKDVVRKAMKKANRKTSKKMKKLPGKIANAIAKNANNGGDVTAESLRGRVNGQNPADDVTSIPDGGQVRSQYVNKSGKLSKKDRKAMTRFAKATEAIGAQPVPGGPVLHGAAPVTGVFPPGVGGADSVAKSEGEQKLEALAKAAAEAGPVGSPERMQAEEALTLERLRQGHESGAI